MGKKCCKNSCENSCQNKCGCSCGCHCCPPQPPEPPVTTDSCCCKDSVLYALLTIKEHLDTEVTVITFNSQVSGEIGDFYGDDQVVKIGDTYVSLCNILEITFADEPVSDESYVFDCSTDECCCNSGLATVLTNIVGSTFPVELETDLDVEIIDNNASVQRISDVYGICSGILWAEVSGGGNEPYVAIPLCSIFSISQDDGGLAPVEPTLEERVSTLEREYIALENRVSDLED